MLNKKKKPAKKKLDPRGNRDKNFMRQIGKLAAEVNKGNNWWEQRSKHGRDTLFKNPELLLEAFDEYTAWNENNPDYAAEWRDKRLVKIPLKRVLLIGGFLAYCDAHTDYWHEFK